MKQTGNRIKICTFAMVITVMALLAFTALPVTTHAAQQTERTVLLYLCGSNLETQHAMATYNLEQILRAKFSQSGRVKVVVMTGGSKQWHMESDALADPDNQGLESKDGTATISSTYNQVWEARGADAAQHAGKMVMLDGDGITGAEGQKVESKDELMSDPETLKAFINYGVENFPAKKYDLILWDHGGGPNNGFAHDEHDTQEDTMHLSEIMDALSHNKVVSGDSDGNGKFDFVDFDACVMGSVDIALLMADVADYYIASPETEPGYGQYYGPCEKRDGVQYKSWLDKVGQTPDMNGYEIGKIIVNDFIAFYDKGSGDGAGQKGTLAVIDTKKLADGGMIGALTEIDSLLRQQADGKNASGELPFYDEMTSVRNSIQYGGCPYFDLGNLMGQLPVVQYEFSGGTPQLTNQYKDAATKITKVLQDPDLIYARGTKGIGGETHVYMNAEGNLRIGELRTSGLYIFFLSTGDSGVSDTYWQEITKAAKVLPAKDPRKEFLEGYRRTMLDYDLIGKTGKDVGDLVYSGTAKDKISYASLCRYWNQEVDYQSLWKDMIQPLLKKRGGEDVSKGWMDTLIKQQAAESLAANNVKAEKNENSYHFTLSDVNKRVIDDVHMDLTAELPAAEAAIENMSKAMSDFLKAHPELTEYHIGSIDGSEYIDMEKIDTSSPEKQQESLIRWMSEPVSEWDLALWDGKCYAVRDADGGLHAADVDPSDFSLLVQYKDGKSASSYSLAGLLFGEDGALSEVAFIDENTGPVFIEAAALKEAFDFMPVQYIDLMGLIQLQLPMSRSAIHISKDNFQKIRLEHADVAEVKDIADTDGDGIATDRKVTVTDIYGSDMDITDSIKAANTLKVSGKTVRIKAGKLKKKTQTVSRKKAVSVSKAVGKVTYKLTSVSKSKHKKYFKVNAKNGNITVKKGLKKGTYKLKISVSATGNTEMKAVAKTATVTVRVR